MAAVGVEAAEPVELGRPVAAGPTPAGERVEVVDVLRGFALLGILVVNMLFFAWPVQLAAVNLPPWTSPIDVAAEWAIRFFAEGKFYSLFSLLFGLGLTFQMARAEARGARFGPLYVRRLLVLLLIGLAHAYLLWVGDILVTYAVLGFVLMLFRKRSPRTLLTWAVVLVALPVLFMALSVASIQIGRADPQAAAEIDRSFAEAARDYQARIEEAIRGYRQPSYLAVAAQRARDVAFMYPLMLFAAPSVFAMFLVGVWTGKRGVFRDAAAHRPFLRHVFTWGLAVGVVGNLAFVGAYAASSRMLPTPLTLLATAGQAVGAPALCFAYASGLTLLFQQPRWRPRLEPLAPLGRMALTNYLLQSLVCTTIFNGYGLGLYGQVGPAVTVVLAVAIWLAQIPLSSWWLRRYQYGPAEWLWRSLTYLRWQPLRAGRPVAV